MKQFLYQFLLIAFLSICVLIPENMLGQKPLTRKLSFLEGLTSDVVYDLFVDTEGLLYLATDKGLMTYNGVHFEQFQNPESLGSSVTNIQQDKKGIIWCKNFANQLFYLHDDELVADQNIDNLLRKTANNLVDYCIASNSKYILTPTVLYNYVDGKFTALYDVSKRKDEILNSIVFDGESLKLYVSSNYFLYVFRNNILIKREPIINNQKVLEIYKGKLSYCTKAQDKNCYIDDTFITLKIGGINKTHLNRLSATKDNLWLCTNKGIYQYDDEKRSFKNGFLRDSRITDIVQDLEGNHWISTLDEGLYMMPSRKMFELQVPTTKKMSYTRIKKGPNGNYFVGTSDGRVSEISPAGASIMQYETNWDNTIEFVNFCGDTLLTNYGFFKIGNSKLLSKDIYFGKYLEQDARENFLIAAPSFGGIIPKSLTGLPDFPNENNKYKVIRYGTKNTQTIVFRNKRSKSVLYHPSDQEYYYGFIDGLFVYDLKGNEKEIRTKNNEAIIAADMLVNEDGSVWVATSQRGVFLLKDKKIVTHLSNKNGLSDNYCRRIVKEGDRLWVVTESGLDYYDGKTNRIKNAQLNLCLKGITINDLAVLQQIVAIATNKGIFYFDKSILEQVVLPNFSFTHFLVNNKEVNVKKHRILDFDENNINIKFNTIHYKSLGNYKYRYRLKGLEDKWYNSSSSAKNINFLALKPGEYKFQINIKIGERYTPIQEIEFEIGKPFWLRIWFQTVSVVFILALMYLIYRWTELKTRRSEELKEQLALSQLTALRAQMNPHFIFNVLNAVQGLIYSNQKSKASDYLGKFSDLMRKILDTSDKNEVTIEKEFETIDLYVSLEKARFEDDFEYNIAFPENIDLSNYTIPSMIIQPFVENAIKHGLMHKMGHKMLDIRVELLEDVWCFTIDDNGIGRKASEIINQKIKKHISFATKAIDNRVKLISKIAEITIDIEIIDKKTSTDDSSGTRIKIYIPNVNK